MQLLPNIIAKCKTLPSACPYKVQCHFKVKANHLICMFRCISLNRCYQLYAQQKLALTTKNAGTNTVGKAKQHQNLKQCLYATHIKFPSQLSSLLTRLQVPTAKIYFPVTINSYHMYAHKFLLHSEIPWGMQKKNPQNSELETNFLTFPGSQMLKIPTDNAILITAHNIIWTIQTLKGAQ